MDEKEKYSKIKKHTNNWVNWFFEIFIDLINISKKWILSFWDFIKMFFYDLISKDKNWKYKLSSIVAFSVIIWFSIFLPLNSIFDWWKWKYREYSIKYSEVEIPTKTEIEKEVDMFAKDYTNSFWVNCDWFKKHDVDIAMYSKYKRLERPSYECAAFNKNNRVLLFPIDIWTPYWNDLIISINVKFWKIYYDSNWAIQYTTVNSELWKFKDENNFLRIDKMNNIQRYDFPKN